MALETFITPPNDQRHIRVSTIFLGIDYQWIEGPPILFETAVFFPEQEWSAVLQRAIPRSEIAGRTGTWEQAEAKHQDVCEHLLAAIPGATAGETVMTQPPSRASMQPDVECEPHVQ